MFASRSSTIGTIPEIRHSPVLTGIDECRQAMNALYRTRHHEQHDFSLASQHPSASPALKQRSPMFSTPARMWKHGTHSFLEFLRHHHPKNLEHMLAFIYLAYQMMAVLYDTIGSFRSTWIKWLGNKRHYRMLVGAEDIDERDREIWAGVARPWYDKVADAVPALGRLCHHLAIPAKSQMLQQIQLRCHLPSTAALLLNARVRIIETIDPGHGESLKLYLWAFRKSKYTICISRSIGLRHPAYSEQRWGPNDRHAVRRSILLQSFSNLANASRNTCKSFTMRLWRQLTLPRSAYTLVLCILTTHPPGAVADISVTQSSVPGRYINVAPTFESSQFNSTAAFVALGIALVVNSCYAITIVFRKDGFWPLPRVLSGVIVILCAAVSTDRSGAFDPGAKLPIYVTAVVSTMVNVFVEHRRALDRAPTSQTQAATTRPSVSREELFWLIFGVASMMTLVVLMPWYAFGDGNFATALPIAAWVGGTVCAYIL